MYQISKNATRLLLLAATVLFGACSNKAHMSREFTRQLGIADNVVVVDWYHGSRMALTAQEAKPLIQALIAAKEESKDSAASTAPMCKIEFYRGTNLLTTIPIQEKWFATADGEFIEESGALTNLQRRLERDHAAQRAWISHFAKEMFQTPKFANIQEWSVETINQYANRQLRTSGEGQMKRVEYRMTPPWLEGTVRSTQLGMPNVYTREGQPGTAEAVVLDWSLFGFIIGPTNYVTTYKAWYVTNVAAGIYAYHMREERGDLLDQ
jgi:hypothetical protein